MSYLRFEPASPDSGFPAGSVAVLSRRDGDVLGVISWYPRWREFVVEPKPDTVWSRGCLREIVDRIVSMTYARELTAARALDTNGTGRARRVAPGDGG